jgi:hypothetical protein
MPGVVSGILVLPFLHEGKSWMPACAGMTWGVAAMLAADLIVSPRA